MRLRQWLLGLVLLWAGQSVAAVQITQIHVVKEQAQKVLLFELTAPLKSYRQMRLEKPPRCVLELDGALLKTKLNANTWTSLPVQSIRTGILKGGVRLVFDLTASLELKLEARAATDAHGPRLALIFPPVQQVIQASQEPVVKVVSSVAKKRDVLVVIDPGHGGKDPGASGRHGSHEKNIVLQISKRLAQIINQEPGMRAKLTRTRDRYLTLRQRLEITRSYNPDVFIAIHADAFKNHRAHGASVFALSERGASSEAARWLAAKENYSELGGVDLSDKTDLLRSVLIDLSQTATISESLKMGRFLLQEIDDVTKLHKTKVEQARFVVLKSPDTPSVLVETGFISNPKEERALCRPSYQKKLAQAINRGLKRYFRQHPLHGTWFEKAQSMQKRHRVRRGETLSLIAHRYHVKLSDLMRLNHLKKHTIRIGDVLRIPS